jgi:RNA ligase (TIGR02306 family)
MSEFAVHMVKLDHVYNHPNADLLDIAEIGGYKAIVLRDSFKTDDYAIYIPEDALVPPELLAAQGLEGALSGPQRNRVKPKRLRGIFSEGLVFPFTILQNLDVSATLGIVKYEPTVPSHLAGQVYTPKNCSLNGNLPIHYDIENIKKYPGVLEETEEVVLTEKIHGTFMQVGYDSTLEPDPELFGDDNRGFVVSKGLGHKGFVFKNAPENAGNLYVQTALKYDLFTVAKNMSIAEQWPKVVICGEVFGNGVQDLTYGAEPGEVNFRVFDIYAQGVDERGFVDWRDFFDLCEEHELPRVPLLFKGPWQDIQPYLADYTAGNSVLASTQIREGCVIKPTVERRIPRRGRVIFKSISEAYALRKNGTDLT